MSRRSALKLGAGAALLPSLALPDPKVAIGCNHNVFHGMRTRVPGTDAVRIYITDYGYIPRRWPDRLPSATSWAGGPVIPPGTEVVLSIRPMPHALFAGLYDDRIRGLVRSAPPNQALNAFPEAGPGNPMGYPASIDNATTISRVHRYLRQLCRGTNVRYGSIICAPANQIVPWLGERLDWYGLDTYCFPAEYRKPDGTIDVPKWLHRMRENRLTWQRVSGTGNPTIKICETNAPHDSNRSAWFTMVAGWLAIHGGANPAMLTYWNPEHDLAHGGLSGPWPPSEGVVDTLQFLVRKYSMRKAT